MVRDPYSASQSRARCTTPVRIAIALALASVACTVLRAHGLTWTEDDWSHGGYVLATQVDGGIQPGILVLENRLNDMRFLASPTSFQGLYSMAVLHDTLWITASDYPYQFDGAEVIDYDYLTGQFEVDYEPYESGLHLIKRFGDSLYVPGPDSMDPWSAPGSIYLYTGQQWIEKETLPYAVHVNDVEVVNGITYATTGHANGPYYLSGCVWISYDYGSSFTNVLCIRPTPEHGIRRFFGAGHIGDRVFVQSDGYPPQNEVVYSTTNGTDWDTIPVPGMPQDKQAMFTVWGDSLLMTIHDRMYIWDGAQFHGYWLPFQGYRWCRGIEKYKGRLYGGGLGGTLYRWVHGSQWETIGQVVLDPATEEIEAMATCYGRLFISSSRPQQGMTPRLYVSAAVPVGYLISGIHDLGAPAGAGVIDWTGFEPGTASEIRFQLRSAQTVPEMQEASFIGPDGLPSSYYSEPATPLALAHWGNRYFQYKVELLCPDGLNMPFLDSVTLTADSLDVASVSPGEPGKDAATGRVSSAAGPLVLRFFAPQPNPARAASDLRVRLEDSEPSFARGAVRRRIELMVVDLQGRIVRRATVSPAADGAASWSWDLCDEQGHRVPGGVYRAMASMDGADCAPTVQTLTVLP
jgi:hypothetical protein